MVSETEWWALKLVTLLHDPPWKPWVITAAFGNVGRVISKREDDEKEPAGSQKPKCTNLIMLVPFKKEKLLAHEAESYVLLKLLVNEIKNRNKHESDILDKVIREFAEEKGMGALIRSADSEAATIDRWLLPPVKEVRGEQIRYEEFLNMFNPDYKVSTCVPNVENICKFISSLIELAKKSGSIKELYFVLYSALEPLWYKYTMSKVEHYSYPVPAADTRVPHHTVFDHNYASTMIINHVACKDGEGYIVVLDIKGIQKFIGVGRKTRDYWAGSWLVSAISWLTVRDLINAFGPDIVIIPSINTNPFYIALLKAEYPNTFNEIENLFKEILEWKEWPDQPLMPATITLLLPSINCNEYVKNKYDELMKSYRVEGKKDEELLKNLLNEIFYNKWQNLIEVIIRDEKFIRFINKLKDYDKEQIFDRVINEIKEPPFIVETIVIKLSEVLNKAKNELSILKDELKLSDEEINKWSSKLMFHIAFTDILHSKKEESIEVAVEPGVLAIEKYHEFTKSIYESSSRSLRFRYCTNCGILPAVIHVPRVGIGYEVMEEFLRESGLPVILDEGEHLCFYCLIRRFLTTKDILKGVIEKVFKIQGVDPEIEVLSTSDVATIWYLIHASKKLSRQEMGQIINKLLGQAKVGSRRDILGQYRDVIESLSRSEALGLIEAIWYRGAEEALLAEDMGKDYGDIRGILEGKAGSPIRYYALIKGDGDNVGKKLLRGILRINYNEYIDKVIRNVAQNQINDIKEKMAKIVNKVLKQSVTTIITPAYLYTLSRSLMAISILDSIMVRWLLGFVVYAGGDDVMAIVPAWSPDKKYVIEVLRKLNEKYGINIDNLIKLLDALKDGGTSVVILTVLLTRSNYWGLLFRRGFNILGSKIVIQAPIAYGRSYGVLITHYRDPLSAAYLIVNELEELKDKAKYAIYNKSEQIFEKDVTVIAYGRTSRNLLKYAVILPNIDYLAGGDVIGSPLTISLELAMLIDAELISKGFFNDYVMLYKDKINYFSKRGRFNIGEMLIKDLIDRNVKEGVEKGIKEELINKLKPYVKYILNDGDTLLSNIIIGSHYIVSGSR